jgi:hypothetical protein
MERFFRRFSGFDSACSCLPGFRWIGRIWIDLFRTGLGDPEVEALDFLLAANEDLSV